MVLGSQITRIGRGWQSIRPSWRRPSARLARVRVVDSQAGWDGQAKPVQADGAPPRGDTATFVFKGLAPGAYAVLVTHGYTSGPSMLTPGHHVAEGSWAPLLGPGRPLDTDRSMVAAYALVIFAVVLRLAALQPSAASVHLLHLAATVWALAFALYLWRFVPMMIRPRPDRAGLAGPESRSR